MSLSASKCIKQDNRLIANALPKRFKTHVFWTGRKDFSNTQAMQGQL